MIKREYYSNGQLMRERPSYEGQLHGTVKRWYDNGQLYYEDSYYQGQLHGPIKEWYKSGQIKYESYWLYDNKVTREEYRRHELIVKLSGL